MLGDKSFPNDSFVQTWRSGLGGQVVESLGYALLLPADIKHYSGYRDEDLIHKLKWQNIAVSTPPPLFVSLLLSLFIYLFFVWILGLY